jgi:DNA-binding NtrC family response regulator
MDRGADGLVFTPISWHRDGMRVLVADDDEGVLMAIELLLQREHMTSARAKSPAEVVEQLARASADAEPFDAVLLDLNYERDTTSGHEGMSLLSRLRKQHPDLAVVVMTGWASIEGAVEAMRRGAVDYVPKPWDNRRLVELLRGLGSEGLVGGVLAAAPEASSVAMRALYALIEQVAFSDVPVLITGEHGSGKELIARAVHEKSGRSGKFVALNAGALAEGTFESELFGHVRGAYTDAKTARDGAFARAEAGTLFLDEVANMPLSQQAKLLRVLQERQYQPLGASAPRASTARVVSATNADIEALARAGQFRPDLLYRLNTIRLHVPPLRERLSELPGLVQTFVAREVARYGLPSPRLAAGVLRALEAHRWPGNVRELEHVIQRAVLLSARASELGAEHLALDGQSSPPAPHAPPGTAHASLPSPLGALAPEPPRTVRDAERAAILQALERHPEDRRAAAESLGLSRSAFYRRLSQHGIRPPK